MCLDNKNCFQEKEALKTVPQLWPMFNQNFTASSD